MLETLYTAGGEYWITGEGDPIFCDGDAGFDVPNHAMVVVKHCAQNLVAKLEALEDNELAERIATTIESWIEDVVDCVAIRTQINDEIDQWVDEGIATHDQAQDIFGTIREMIGAEYGSLEDQEIDAALGQHDDPREIGVRWGWVRANGANLQTAKLNRHTCGMMVDFAMFSVNQEWTVEWLEDDQFVAVFGVPTAELDKPAAIRKHRKGY